MAKKDGYKEVFKSRVLILFGKNYSFRNDTGQLVEGGKVFMIEDYFNDSGANGSDSDICEGYPVLDYTLPYDYFIKYFNGFGVYDAFFTYEVSRSFKTTKKLCSMKFVRNYEFDFKNSPELTAADVNHLEREKTGA